MNVNAQVLKDYVKADYKKDWAYVRFLLQKDKTHIGYLGWNGYGNLGDEAPFESYRYLAGNRPIKTFRIIGPFRKLASDLRLKSPFSMVGLGGGTLINQSRFGLEQVEYLINENIPMFCIGTGVASKKFWQDHPGVHSGDDMARWAKVLKQFKFVGVRGPMSQKRLKAAGLDVPVVGDAALSLASDTYDKRAGKKIIGVNVSFGSDNLMWGNPDTMISELSTCLTNYLSKGYEVRILPIWKEDLPAAEALLKRVNHQKCKIVRSFASVDTYMAALNECDVFIGQKLHATIFATMLRIPSIMLAYRPKCLDYMASIDQSEYTIRTDEVTAEVVTNLIDDLIAHSKDIQQKLDHHILRYKRLQREAANSIFTA